MNMQDDSLYRISIKCLIKNDDGRVLVVKESGSESWDLPGGGVEHGETVQSAISRELKEEIDFEGIFSYRVVMVDNPAKLRSRDIWQMRVIVELKPEIMNFSVGEDSSEVQFIDPILLKDSQHEPERKVYKYMKSIS